MRVVMMIVKVMIHLLMMIPLLCLISNHRKSCNRYCFGFGEFLVSISLDPFLMVTEDVVYEHSPMAMAGKAIGHTQNIVF